MHVHTRTYTTRTQTHMKTHNLHTDTYTRTQTLTHTYACTDTYKLDLENLGQAQGVQYSQCYHSMANMNLFKSHILAFFC